MKKKILIGILFMTFCFFIASCTVRQVTYTVTFEYMNGSSKVVKVDEGKKLKEPTLPTKSGYDFVCWSTTSDENGRFNFENKIDCDLTLYAVWKETTTHTVTFNYKNGSQNTTEKVADGKKVVEPSEPIYENYMFVGWSLTEEATGLYNFDTPVTSDIMLYAIWNEKVVTLVKGVSLSKNFVFFNANKEVKENKRTEFFDLDQPFMVGTDNYWSAKPEVNFVKYNKETKEQEPTIVDSWNYHISLYLFDEEEYQEVEKDSELIDGIDSINCSVDFSDKAINKKFKISIFPEGLTDKQMKDVDTYTISMEFVVIKGYNVYNSVELAYMDNRDANITSLEVISNPTNEAESWHNFKIANGLKLNYYPNTFIFQTDMVLDKDKVPSYFFYSASELNKTDADYDRALGSMKDFKEMYERTISDNEEFNIYGNYFKLDCSRFKEVVRNSDNEIVPEGELISHSTLFRITGSESGKSNFANINIIGNAPRIENVLKAGGQIFTKIINPAFTAYNIIVAYFFIPFFPEYGGDSCLIEKCKAYDSFNCFVYNWGRSNVIIKDSEMIGAGGPVIIQDHVGPGTDGTSGHPASTKIVSSNLQSYVTGTEGWFTVVKASGFVPSITGLNPLFTPFGKSILKENSDKSFKYFNLICVNKSDASESITANVVIRGSLAIDNKPAFDFGATNPGIAGLIATAGSQGAPVFQTTENGMAYGNTSGLFDLTNTQIMDPSNAIFQGDYICIFYLGMAFTLGYFESGQVYEGNK